MLTHLTDTVPEFQWAPEYDILPTEPTFGVRALFFRGCDYKGKRTRVFAYYGIPEDLQEKAFEYMDDTVQEYYYTYADELYK